MKVIGSNNCPRCIAVLGVAMAATAHERGWPIEFRSGAWVYRDTGRPITGTRVCRRCGRPPTPEGHDACLGVVPGVASACCGHGAEPPFARETLRRLPCIHAEIDVAADFDALAEFSLHDDGSGDLPMLVADDGRVFQGDAAVTYALDEYARSNPPGGSQPPGGSPRARPRHGS